MWFSLYVCCPFYVDLSICVSFLCSSLYVFLTVYFPRFSFHRDFFACGSLLTVVVVVVAALSLDAFFGVAV